MLELIRTSGQNSLDLINDLLQFTARQTFKKELVELFDLLSYCVELMRLKAKEKQQHIELDATQLQIYMNREKMWRVMSNLIANAIKFSPFGTTVLVKMIKTDEHVLITVKDQGIGIPDEMKEKIFDMFTEARRVGTDGEQPFGMGLAIAKQIVEAHEGRIWFHSAQDQGTTFYVELPVAL
ncbi:Sensor histidine kinase YycG [compost metagenome]